MISTNGNGYVSFLDKKLQLCGDFGFDPIWMHPDAFHVQQYGAEWAIRKGRGLIGFDCGLGKTLLEFIFAVNILRKENVPVLIAAPLAVSHQIVRESEKFGIDDVSRCDDGKHKGGIVVTNYERLHYFNPNDFGGFIGDESSRVKHADSKTRSVVTEFARRIKYRLLCTATAAPNDYHELGTSSEVLGYLGYQDMLTRFFKQLQSGGKRWDGFGSAKYRFKGHAEEPFWRWVCSWARTCRKPSDLGFDNEGFILPPLNEIEHEVQAGTVMPGMLFSVPARNMREQKQERRETLTERCEKVAEIVSAIDRPTVSWCHLNDEGDMLERIIPDAEQVSGSMPDELKEERLVAFQTGQLKRLVIKPKIGAFGLNWQHCSDITTFPSHSYEQYYQLVRRCYRFGQKRPVNVHIVTTEGEVKVLKNLQRKAAQCDNMFDSLVANMLHELSIDRSKEFRNVERLPQWLSM